MFKISKYEQTVIRCFSNDKLILKKTKTAKY